MSGLIQVTPQDLETKSQEFSAESQGVGEQVGRISGKISDLSGVWKGSSSTAFADQWERLKPSLVEMQTMLDEVSQQLQNTANALRDADEEIANKIRG
ncbi:WXG100 family type VII secretion target [Metabacillus sp. 84]|uniref:WXG100 family type VII secretion target n=1 Tax=unclassified Metabacillus TaxID=2675274 RepID=UPI003CEAA0FE